MGDDKVLSLKEGILDILQSCILTELKHKWLHLSQVVPWDTRKEMMNDLELQPAVEPVEPSRGAYIHGSSQGLSSEVLLAGQVLSVHTIVGDVDLQVQYRGCDVRN